MDCSVCKKQSMWLYFIGVDNVCTKCIAKYTVFKDIKKSDESRMKKAMRVFEVNSFEDLKKIKYSDIEGLENMKDKRKQTTKYKKVKPSIGIDRNSDTMDYISEMDQGW